MKFEGQAISVSPVEDGIVELAFDLKGEPVNKFNELTLKELRDVVTKLKAESGVRGLLVTSKKDVFIVGADITEFLTHFKKTDEELLGWVKWANQIFTDIEDLPFPTVTAINGFALGGGFEMCLSTVFRVASTTAKIGLPESKLGIMPGWGGTVRLSRLCGADNAIEWIAGGEQYSPEVGAKMGAVDAVVAPDKVRAGALSLLKTAIAGKIDWKAKRDAKIKPLTLSMVEAMMAFEGAKGFILGKAGSNYPAPIIALESMQMGAMAPRDEALLAEHKAFVKACKTPQAGALVSIFLGDQAVKKAAKKASKTAKEIKVGAVLGAGIMGGGIAYQSASKGTPIIMKDIRPEALELGLSEAAKLLGKQVERGKLTPPKMAETMGRIRASLSYGDFQAVDIVVEAVVENEKVKKAVLAEVEAACRPGTILTSNTSTISITRLAEGLKAPENFCGMHFFNPVHRMPLVEIIRGAKSSDVAVGTAVAYATAMGKTAVVVNDCPGFLVNRVLFPYFAAFEALLHDGVDFPRIDKVMEKFGWPMGPAYLLDVVGIDTAHHANAVMAAAFPDRMKATFKTAIDVMVENKRYGQKNGLGFYKYSEDKKGKPKKEADAAVPGLIAPLAASKVDVKDEDIVLRMMLPMVIECARCLDEKIVETPAEVDISLIYGLGFPPFRGGALRYADAVGLGALCEAAKRFSTLGKLYEPTAGMLALAKAGNGFHQG